MTAKIISDKLKENRPTLSDSSLRTYTSILSNLYKKVYPDTELDLAKFQNQKKFLTFMKDTDGSKRKTYLSALVVLCPSCEQYAEQMNKDGQAYKALQKQQIKTDKQKENWVEQDELSDIMTNLENEANKVFKMKNPTMTELQVAQNYIILCLVSGKYIPIRRSLDWTELMISDYDIENENHLSMSKKGWKFIFNVYKTHRFHDDQEVAIPANLKKILTKWLKLLEKVCPNATHLLIDNKCGKLTPTKITQRLNAVFGKKASINILRHSFISHKYKDMPSLTELETEAEAMGHSLKEHLEYIKKDE
jgi:hypothetical protein